MEVDRGWDTERLGEGILREGFGGGKILGGGGPDRNTKISYSPCLVVKSGKQTISKENKTV